MTLQRLYLETMEAVLKGSNKVIIDKSAQGSSGVLPYLPLPALGGAAAPASGAAAPGATSSAPPRPRPDDAQPAIGRRR